ncbi:MAG: cytochrome ubiquinol oxidase subunit I [Bdellovibrionaceae bacterium]|nr:cytochrome ubiquinol oxidase subunit I [Pseudobdellovibrionaceae bacterium]
MSHLLAARLQMALSLGFHIVFASIGMAMPFLMLTAYRRFLKTKNPEYRELTRTWSKGVAIFFAVGAVSGTALSFELGLLWPGFMKYAGPIVGLPFALEGAAFFLEAIAIGIFLYGWERVPPRVHWLSGLVVGLSGLASAFFVISANGWMNAPAGFDWNGGNPINVDPLKAMMNEAFLLQAVHMSVAAFQAVGFAVAGMHAWLYLKRGYSLHFKAVKIALVWGALASLIQPVIGDLSAKAVAQRQPEKFAAMEAHFETQSHAGLLIGGIPDEEKAEVRFGLHLPGLLSFLAHGDFSSVVKGLEEFPRDDWPPVLVTHLAFQLMVGFGMLLLLVGTVGVFQLWRKKTLSVGLLKTLVLCIPFGFIAMEAGWVVTEVGRQPWVIYRLLRTAEAVTPRPAVWVTLFGYGALYLFLCVVLVFVMQRQVESLHKRLAKTGGAS